MTTSTPQERYSLIKNNRNYILPLLISQSYDELSKLFTKEANIPDQIINMCSSNVYVFIIDGIQTIDDNSYHNYFGGADIQISISDLINAKLFAYCIHHSDEDFLKELLIVDNREDMLERSGEDRLDDIVENDKIFKIILSYMNLKQTTIEKFFESAINMQCTKVVIILLDMGLQPSADSIKSAIENDATDTLEILLEYNCDNIQSGFDSCVFYDTTMNYPACKMYSDDRIYANVDTIKILLKYNINILGKLNDLLYYACQNDELDLVIFCVEYGECDTVTALKVACLNNNFEIMTYLLELGVVINLIDDKDLLYTDIKMIKFLLQHEYVFTTQVLFETFYILLLATPTMEIINYMTDIGADFEKLFYTEEYLSYYPDRKSWLVNIICYNKIDVMKYLVNNYADKLDFDKLIIMGIVNGKVDIVKYLLTVKPEFDICKSNIFVEACYHGHLSSVKYLLDMGVDVNSIEDNLFNTVAGKKDIKNDLTYHGTNGNGCADILKLLFSYNIPIPKNNIFGSYDDRILDIDIIRYLVTHGFDINEDIISPDIIYLMGYMRETELKIINLLDLSIYRHKTDIIEFLLENGMDPTVNDNNAIKISNAISALDVTELLMRYAEKS